MATISVKESWSIKILSSTSYLFKFDSIRVILKFLSLCRQSGICSSLGSFMFVGSSLEAPRFTS